MPLEAFMEMCNAYYYATRDPLGADGDFTTAPEICQMFGELCGAALADCWKRSGGPDTAIYAELGPGRGTLAADALRVMRKTGFGAKAHLVETSETLRAAQLQAVPDAVHHQQIADLPKVPLLCLANEFFDALPIRQMVDGFERHVVLTGGELAFDRDGTTVELSPVREGVMEHLARHLATHGGVGIVIDYGHTRSAPGDTLQAVKSHRFAAVLADPGEQDLTAHVDFEGLAEAAVRGGARVTELATQGDWLSRLGLEARAAALAAANPARADEILAAARRLSHPEAMGSLFKVLAVHAPDWPAPVGFGA